MRTQERKMLPCDSKKAIEDRIKVCFVQLICILIWLIAWGYIIKEQKRIQKTKKSKKDKNKSRRPKTIYFPPINLED